ncbi:hypothetical protein ABZT48_33845 [Streptomyces avermitilis]|uniref:hypothetical protein n=1 Tax=Streptomyces avermitilis TaxID=33903 RepID=UPI0033B523FE
MPEAEDDRWVVATAFATVMGTVAATAILDLDGFHPRVQDVVLNTPGARELIANLADYAACPPVRAASRSDVQEAGTEVLTGLPKDTPS